MCYMFEKKNETLMTTKVRQYYQKKKEKRGDMAHRISITPPLALIAKKSTRKRQNSVQGTSDSIHYIKRATRASIDTSLTSSHVSSPTHL